MEGVQNIGQGSIKIKVTELMKKLNIKGIDLIFALKELSLFFL